ncbi:efflux RND transporter permease subunit [Pukyongiella litopenaei]|uniref:Efflux RND transporter permease subunit n=1 Tax=Pukyongiella litopenaei TaxID=2605946 RepID=A0A2S0MKH6_9RHOB|nr:efflux RND transporter permease subunit [Pukyongiella litopenaei]AVO36379.1 efflux RND transporter permease subunit [Pukyongiella litopenaei]
MTGIVDWAAARARMVLAFIALSLVIGASAYVGLPKEGEPDIDIPMLFVSVQFPGISAEDSESLLIKPMETELSDLDGLDKMTATAAENYAGILLEFDFGWDKSATVADVRDAMNSAQGKFPDGAEQYEVTEINFSEFPIVIVNLTGAVPERTMAQIARDLRDEIETLDSVLEAGIAGSRDEMLEVIIDPLRLESYNVTALELINVVQNNNQLIAAGEVETAQGTFAVKIPSSFDDPLDVYDLPVKTNGDRVVTLGDLAQINFTFEDRVGTARFNGEKTVALQVVKRKGFNLIDTVDEVRTVIAETRAKWPPELQAAVEVGTSNDQSRIVGSMVRQLEGSVLTAVALVMIVVLAALGSRAALLVGFAIPTSFLLCFAYLAAMGVSISNIVMFGLILAVGMLVDGAIVVVEYADKRIHEGVGPMHAYVEAAKRMFWPIVASTATTLCAFLPMLFWPGVPGEFMGMLPITLIFVLSASLVVALVYLPVVGGVTGRISRLFAGASDGLRARLPWIACAALVPVALYGLFVAAMQVLNPQYLLPAETPALAGSLIGALLFIAAAFAASITLDAARIERTPRRVQTGHRHTLFGHFIKLIAGNPVMPLVAIGLVFMAIFQVVFVEYPARSRGVEFFVESEPEQATLFVRARGNLSLDQADALVREAEAVLDAHPAVINMFAFAGDGGLNTDASGAQVPADTVGRIQFELIPWEDRPSTTQSLFGGWFEREIRAEDYDGDAVIAELETALAELPGFETEILPLGRGPASAKPVHLRLKSDNGADLLAATELARAQFDQMPGLVQIEDTLPLPGIDWQIDVDVEKAGRFGADVATVGAMVQLVTRGILLDTMRVDSSDEEIEIRVRLPDEFRVLSTLDNLRVRTHDGLVPLSNFITRKPVGKLASISRVDQHRFYDVKADVETGLTKLVARDAGTGGETPLALLHEVTGSEVATGPTLTAPSGATLELRKLLGAEGFEDARAAYDAGTARLVPVNANERIASLDAWLDTGPFPASVDWEWTGDREEQAESQAFLSKAFAAALGLMFVILLTQFNSFYNSVLVLLAVIMSTTGVLIGMMVMDQPFSIIMTGTGIVALAGIVVNNNIVLIDTYQEFSSHMPPIEAIVRTAEARIRPVLLTTITTMAGLTPMMFGLSLDFIGGGYSIDSPTSLWWKQLATAVVFGLGIATMLTLIVTPSFLALRVWAGTYMRWIGRLWARLTGGRDGLAARDARLRKAARALGPIEIIWEDGAARDATGDVPAHSDGPDDTGKSPHPPASPLRAAE